MTLLLPEAAHDVAVDFEDRGVIVLPRPRHAHHDLVADAAMRHHQHAVGEVRRLVGVVGDENDGLAGFPPDAQEVDAQATRGQLVQSAERLVHQQDARLDA
jgi:hypothetical protein